MSLPFDRENKPENFLTAGKVALVMATLLDDVKNLDGIGKNYRSTTDRVSEEDKKKIKKYAECAVANANRLLTLVKA